MSYSPTAPTYVSRLDPQFRRFVNVVYHESPTSSMNDLSEGTTESLKSGSFSEKSPEFIAVDAYVDDGSSRIQGQREVSEFYLEYVNVLSSGSETSFTSDDKEIAKSWRESPSLSSNSEQRYNRDRIPSHFSPEDSVFLSDRCQESLYEENEINPYLHNRSGTKRLSDSNTPTFRSFSSEAGSKGSYRCQKDVERFREHLEGIETSALSSCNQEKDNINSDPWFRGQEVNSDGLQTTSRRIHDSLDDLFSEDSELCDSSEVVEDGYSSTSSADSSFVRFALVGKRGSQRMKRNFPTRINKMDRKKKHSSDPSRERRESGGKEGDEGVMACVVSGISGGPAVRVFRNEVSQQTYPRSRRREVRYPRDLEEALTRRDETKSAGSEDNDSEGTRAQNKRSNESGRRIVFGVFRTQGNPPSVDRESGRSCYTKKLHPNRENSIHNMENFTDHDGRLPAFDGNKRFTQDLLSLTASRNDGGGENDGYFSAEDGMNAFSRSKKVTPASGVWKRMSTNAGNEFRTADERVKQKQRENAKRDDQDLLAHSMTRSLTSGKDERGTALESHLSGFIERPIDVSVKAISRTPKVRRPRRKPSEVEQQGLRNENDRMKDSKFLSEEMHASYLERQHGLKDGILRDQSEVHRDDFINIQEPSSALNSATFSLDLSSDGQDRTERGNPEARTEYSSPEAQLKIDKVHGSTPLEYDAVVRKTELMTPVKQTINDSIRGSLLFNSDCDSEWQVCLQKSGRPHPEGHMGVTLVSDLDDFEHSSEGKRTLSQTSESNQANLGVPKSREVSLNYLRGKIARHDSFERPRQNSPITTENWSIDRGVELNAANNSDGVDLNENDSISKGAGDFAAKATRKESGSPAFSGGTTEVSMDTDDTWKGDDVSHQRDEMDIASPEPNRIPGIGLEANEETAYVKSAENDMEIAKQPCKRKDFPSFLDSPNETKRKAAKEDKRETGYSKKIKRLSETYTEGDELLPTIKSEFSLKPFSSTVQRLERNSTERPEEHRTTTFGYPRSLYQETACGEKASKRYFLTEQDQGGANSSTEDVSRETFVRSDHFSTSYPSQTTSSQGTLKSTSLLESRTDRALALADHDDKSISLSPELENDFASTHGISREEIREPQGSFTAPSSEDGVKTFELMLERSAQKRLTEEMPQSSSSTHPKSSIQPSMESVTTSVLELEGKSQRRLLGEIPDISSRSSLIAPLETIASSGPKVEGSGQKILIEKSSEISSREQESFLADPSCIERGTSSKPEIKGNEQRKATDPIPQISSNGHPTSLTAPSSEESVTSSKRKFEASGHSVLTPEMPKTVSSYFQSSPTAPSFIETSTFSEPKLEGREISRLNEENPGTSSRDEQSSSTTPSLKESTATSEPNFEGNEKLVDTEKISKIRTIDLQSCFNASHKETYASSKPKLESKILENIPTPDNGGRNSDGDDSKFSDFSRKENNLHVSILPGDEVVVWDDIESKSFSTGHSLILNNDNEVPDADKESEKKLRSLNTLTDAVLKEDDNRKNLTSSTGIPTWAETSRLEKIVNTPYRYPNDESRANSSSEEFGGYVERDADSLDPKTDHEDREFSNKELCVVENVCYVASTDNDCQWEDGSQSVKLDGDLLVERNAFFSEQEMGSSPSESLEIRKTDDGLVCDEEMRGNEVNEISCTYDMDEYSSEDQVIEVYGNDAPYSTYPENSYSSSGDVNMKTESDALAYVGSKVVSEEIREPAETRKIHLVQPADGLSGRSSYGSDHTESPKENESFCETEANFGIKEVCHQRLLTVSATFPYSNSEKNFEIAPLYEHYTDYSAVQGLDKQCQVEILQDNFRKYESRESQTSFLNGATDTGCQTNKVSDLPNLRGTLQNQSIECQTELPTICCVRCGGPLESFDIHDKLPEECRFTERESQTISGYGHISTSSKECQTSPARDDFSQLLLLQSSAKIIGSKAVEDISFESKGCQTSQKSLLLITGGAQAPQGWTSYHKAGVSDKEIQTSSNVVLVSSPAQCDILPFTDIGVIAARENETSRIVSFDTKECQTVRDLELLLATSKHCQTFSFETISAGNGNRPTLDSKGCQTLPTSQTESKECQTMEEVIWDTTDAAKSSKDDQSVSNISVQCQTISDSTNELYHPLWDRFDSMEVGGEDARNKSSDPLHRNALTISCENKGSQTKPERDILLTSSKLCQTTILDTAMACENKESQTQLDDEIFLILSKACQTIPYGLDDTDSKSSIDGPIGSQDFELSLAEGSDQQLEISSPPNQMASRHRPATYGKSPDTIEESIMGFQFFHGMDETNLCKNNGLEPLSPVSSSVVVEVLDKGCQAMLCDCGNCAEQHALLRNSAEMSSDAEKGYFLFFLSLSLSLFQLSNVNTFMVLRLSIKK